MALNTMRPSASESKCSPSQSAELSNPFASLKFAPLKFAPRKYAPLKSAPLKFAPLKYAPRKSAPLKFAPLKSASRKSAPFKFAPRKYAPRKSAPRKYAPLKSASRKSAPLKSASRKSAPLKFAPLKFSISLMISPVKRFLMIIAPFPSLRISADLKLLLTFILQYCLIQPIPAAPPDVANRAAGRAAHWRRLMLIVACRFATAVAVRHHPMSLSAAARHQMRATARISRSPPSQSLEIGRAHV